MVDLFQQHVNAEISGDIKITMTTMINAPHLNHIPQWQGTGREAVQYFIPTICRQFFLSDVHITTVSHTTGDALMIKELVISSHIPGRN
jgi:carboxymethylenebutenolidase